MERALIVGGGPAGLAAAIGLTRSGVRCELIELTADWRPTGVGLGLHSPPLRAAKALGLFDELLRVGRGQPNLAIRSADGTLLAEASGPNVNDPGDPPFITMSRVALHELMVNEVERLGVPVRLGTTLDSWQETGDGVEAIFTDGTSDRYDMIVGADGIRSRVRQRALPDAPAPEFAGQMIWRMGGECPPGLDQYTIMIAGPHRIGLVPLPDDHLYLWMLDSSIGPERPQPEDQLELFRQRMSAYGGFAPAVAEQAQDVSQLDVRALDWLLVPQQWHSGHVLLLGDAVHATTPHLAYGAGLAIEDGVVLSELVGAGLRGDALGERFFARRFERARIVVEGSLQLSRWEQQSGPPHPDAPGLSRTAMEMLARPI